MAVRQRCVDESHSVYRLCCPGEWLWVDCNGTDGKPAFHRRANLPWFFKICNHFREIALEVGNRWRWSWFFGKKSPYGQIFKKLLQKDSSRHRITSCVQISWNLADRKSAKSCVVYLTKKNKTSARSPTLASARIAPKICQVQLQTIYSEFPKFHPNPFTSGKVIAERVNIIETCHKVFPILGEASSPSNYYLVGVMELVLFRVV